MIVKCSRPIKETAAYFVDGKVYVAPDCSQFNTRGWCVLRQRAEKAGVQFEITAEELEHWWISTPDICNYCGMTVEDFRVVRDFLLTYSGKDPEILRFLPVFKLPNHKKIDSMTKDRRITNVGYCVSNLCKACWICNAIKAQYLLPDEWTIIAPLVIGRLKSAAGIIV